MPPRIHRTRSVIRKLRTAIILASGLLAVAPLVRPAEQLPDLARRVARNESASAAARLNYTYRQEVTVEEFGARGQRGGLYREVRDVIFSPETGRGEQFVKPPRSTLRFLKLTEEDFADIREIQPFLFTEDLLWAYETRYLGTEPMDGHQCHVLRVRPRQVFPDGDRMFDGVLWIHPEDLAVVRSEGKAVPEIVGRGGENRFPTFTTVRSKVDNQHWFPIYTLADDELEFSTGPLRIRMEIKYSDYQRFSADSTVTFGEAVPSRKQ